MAKTLLGAWTKEEIQESHFWWDSALNNELILKNSISHNRNQDYLLTVTEFPKMAQATI